MVNNAMYIADIQREHGERHFLVQRGKLAAVNQAWSHTKLELLTQLKTGVTLHLSLSFAL